MSTNLDSSAAPTPLDEARQATLFRQAALLFALGLVVGLVFTFKIIGHVAIWPVLPSIALAIPGEEGAWHRAHLGLIINAIGIMAFAAGGRVARWSLPSQRTYVACVLGTAWGNSAGFLFAALFGVRGLEFAGAWPNRLGYLCFLVAALTAFVQCGLLWVGAKPRKFQPSN